MASCVTRNVTVIILLVIFVIFLNDHMSHWRATQACFVYAVHVHVYVIWWDCWCIWVPQSRVQCASRCLRHVESCYLSLSLNYCSIFKSDATLRWKEKCWRPRKHLLENSIALPCLGLGCGKSPHSSVGFRLSLIESVRSIMSDKNLSVVDPPPATSGGSRLGLGGPGPPSFHPGPPVLVPKLHIFQLGYIQCYQ